MPEELAAGEDQIVGPGAGSDKRFCTVHPELSDGFADESDQLPPALVFRGKVNVYRRQSGMNGIPISLWYGNRRLGWIGLLAWSCC